MKIRKLLFVAAVVAAPFVAGCASGPYYFGEVGYRAHNIGDMPVDGSIGVSAGRSGVSVNPNVVISSTYYSWDKILGGRKHKNGEGK